LTTVGFYSSDIHALSTHRRVVSWEIAAVESTMLLHLLFVFCFTGDAALAEQQGLILSIELGTTNRYIMYTHIFCSFLLSRAFDTQTFSGI
jgi:hypothetical protein